MPSPKKSLLALTLFVNHLSFAPTPTRTRLACEMETLCAQQVTVPTLESEFKSLLNKVLKAKKSLDDLGEKIGAYIKQCEKEPRGEEKSREIFCLEMIVSFTRQVWALRGLCAGLQAEDLKMANRKQYEYACKMYMDVVGSAKAPDIEGPVMKGEWLCDCAKDKCLAHYCAVLKEAGGELQKTWSFTASEGKAGDTTDFDDIASD